MTPLIAVKKPALEIAHFLQHHLEDYKRQYRLGPEHQKILSDLLNCRTAKMGGRVERCDTCGRLRSLYHSCRNRHCPKCQHMPRERRLAKRQAEILPVNYFHGVFTLPHCRGSSAASSCSSCTAPAKRRSSKATLRGIKP